MILAIQNIYKFAYLIKRYSYVLFSVSILFFFIARTAHTKEVSTTPWDLKRIHQKVTLDYLLESCALNVGDPSLGRGKIPYFDCESYIYGVLDSYQAIKYYIPKTERVCIPTEIAPWQVLNDTMDIFKDKNGKTKIPYNGSDVAAPELLKELHKQYPCK